MEYVVVTIIAVLIAFYISCYVIARCGKDNRNYELLKEAYPDLFGKSKTPAFLYNTVLPKTRDERSKLIEQCRSFLQEQSGEHNDIYAQRILALLDDIRTLDLGLSGIGEKKNILSEYRPSDSDLVYDFTSLKCDYYDFFDRRSCLLCVFSNLYYELEKTVKNHHFPDADAQQQWLSNIEQARENIYLENEAIVKLAHAALEDPSSLQPPRDIPPFPDEVFLDIDDHCEQVAMKFIVAKQILDGKFDEPEAVDEKTNSILNEIHTLTDETQKYYR